MVSVPLHDEPHFRHTDWHGARVVWLDEPEDDRGYLRQQLSKMHADEHCESDFLVFLDSDCFVCHTITPESFLSNGKPIGLIRHWADAQTALPWKAITEKFLAFEPVFEGMCALPAIMDRRVLPLFRDYAKSTHGCSLDEYVLRQPGNNFSEFNALMAFAHRFAPYMFDWRIADPGKDGFTRCLFQRWSWHPSGVEPYRDQYEKILAS